jgi:drug/metabolite transporter (DMT)-like permease
MKLSVTSFPPFLFSGVRNLLAGLVLLAIAYVQGQHQSIERRQLVIMAGLGLVMTGVSNGFTYWGQQRLSSSLAALVWCSMPFFTAIFSHFFLPGHRLNAWRVAGLLLGFSGVWLVLSTQHLDLGAGVNEGKLAIVASAIIWAGALVLSKRWLPENNSTLTTGLQLAAGAIYLLPVAAVAERGASIVITPASIFVFLMMLFGQGCLGYLCYYYLMAKVSPISVSMFSFINPAIAVLLGVILLGEAPYWQMGAGLALVAAGVITVNVLGERERVLA